MGIPIVDSDNVMPKCSESTDKADTKSETNQNKVPDAESQSAKDLIGNCKEFRIDCNKNNLRIIGNCNKIRINQNSGILDIVGNGTRLKILNNKGTIKYTGNRGRIYLGSESTEQTVNYIGCNGILKVVNATELRTSSNSSERTEKCKSTSSCSGSDSETSRKHKTTTTSTSSYSGFNIKNNISLPNLTTTGSCKTANIVNCINLSSSTGNITIKNAINVAI